MGVGGQHLALPHLPPIKRPGSHFTGVGTVYPKAGVDGCGKSRPHLDLNPGTSSQ